MTHQFQSTLDHPNARSLYLGFIKQHRMLLRENRYTADAKRLIKRCQRDLVKIRQRRNGSAA